MADSDYNYCLQEYKYLFQEDLLRGKVAFITGGGSGIGFRIAELFMRHGCNTVIGSRKMEKLQQVLYPRCGIYHSMLFLFVAFLLVSQGIEPQYWQRMPSSANGCQKGYLLYDATMPF